MSEEFDHIVVIQYVMPKALQMRVTEDGAQKILIAANGLATMRLDDDSLTVRVVQIPTKDDAGHICTIAVVLNPLHIATVTSRRMTTEEMGQPIAELVETDRPDGAA